MKRKLLSFLFAVFATTYFCSAQVIFDPATYAGTLPAGMSIVEVDGESYCQIILNGWNNFIEVDPLIIQKSTSFTIEAKYAVGTPGTYVLSNINTFLKLVSPGGDEIGASGAQSVANFALFTVNIAHQDTIGKIQVAGQQKTSWGAVTGDTLWIGKVTVLPDPTRVITKETCGTTPYEITACPGQSANMVTTFTSENGVWNTTHNVRINAFDQASTNYTKYGASYPGMNTASNNQHFLMAYHSRYLAACGGLDTIQWNKINIHGFNKLKLSFGLEVRSNDLNKQHVATVHPSIYVQIDNGTWNQITTNGIFNFDSLDVLQWKYFTVPLEGITGDSINIKFVHEVKSAAFPAGYGQFYLDDIEVKGSLLLADSIVVSASSDTIRTSLGTSQLSAVVYPAEASQWVAWSVNSPIATIDENGLLSALSNGIVIVTATSDDGVTKTYPVVLYGQKPNPMPIAVKVFGSKDNALDYAGTVAIGWETDTVYMEFIVTDDSIVPGVSGAGNNYQVDNIEIYFDMDNSKNVHWPRNGGWVSGDATFDANDRQLRLVLGLAGILDASNAQFPAKVVYERNDTGYTYSVRIAWKNLKTGFMPAAGDEIGFDVLLSDNDSVAHDKARNQFTWVSPTDKAFNDPSLWGTLEIVEGGAFLSVADVEAPTAPANLAGTAGDLAATITWDASTDNTGVMSYIIKQGIFNIDTIVAKATGNTFTSANLIAKQYSYQVIAIDNHGNKSAGSNTIYLDVTNIVGVDVNAATQFGVYPNPIVNELNIDNATLIATVEILRVDGSVVMTSSYNAEELITINTSELASGMYIIRMTTTDNNVVVSKISKK